MTLTVCVGSSGSGKTTLLNDVVRQGPCTYVRQYHGLRPCIEVSRIPHFDPASLPFWDVYVKEDKYRTIKVGGTMAGRFTPGLSGGQRKLLLFELIYQRTADMPTSQLIVLDEPFAGVTEDFLPYIVARLKEMCCKHTVLIVTNDHIQPLIACADTTIAMFTSDRTKVLVDNHPVDRSAILMSFPLGNEYSYAKVTSDDLHFLLYNEVVSSQPLRSVATSTVLFFGLFVATFWNSPAENVALLLIGSTALVNFFCVQPYFASLVPWRVAITEEAEARLHGGVTLRMNESLKTLVGALIVVATSLIEYGCVNAVTAGSVVGPFKFWFAMFADLYWLSFTTLCIALYTSLPGHVTQQLGTLPFLLMTLFSTTFSPGSGIQVVNDLRYLFPRFYFWCMLPGVQDTMEGCPVGDDDGLTVLYLFLSSLLPFLIFGAGKGINAMLLSNRDLRHRRLITRSDKGQAITRRVPEKSNDQLSRVIPNGTAADDEGVIKD